MQDEKSQHKNRAKGDADLRSRLLERERERQQGLSVVRTAAIRLDRETAAPRCAPTTFRRIG